MLGPAMGAMGVGQLLGHAGERLRIDVNAGRDLVAGIGTLDEQYAHDATPIILINLKVSHSGPGRFQQPAELCHREKRRENDEANDFKADHGFTPVRLLVFPWSLK
jgi:hypothetical protein